MYKSGEMRPKPAQWQRYRCHYHTGTNKTMGRTSKVTLSVFLVLWKILFIFRKGWFLIGKQKYIHGSFDMYTRMHQCPFSEFGTCRHSCGQTHFLMSVEWMKFSGKHTRQGRRADLHILVVSGPYHLLDRDHKDKHDWKWYPEAYGHKQRRKTSIKWLTVAPLFRDTSCRDR